MDNLNIISNGKYKLIEEKLTEGAYSKVYEVIRQESNDKYIVKIQKISDRFEAVNEIKVLKKLKKNKSDYYQKIHSLLNTQDNKTLSAYLNTSKIIDIEDFYSDQDYVYIIFKKYEYTLEDFNILYHKTFKESLPINLINKLVNSLFLGLYELSLSKTIHCDIKPNNIMITSSNKKIKELFNLIKKKKMKKDDLIFNIDIIYIDFNLSQKYNDVCKSTKIQTLYYMAPEIILGDSSFTESIDLWSIGCIIYELLTGKYLFDIYNYNNLYGTHYSKYKNEKSSDSSESSYSSYEYDNQEELILLHFYRECFGDNIHLNGNNVNKYYNSINDGKYLLGTMYKKEPNCEQFIQHIKNNMNIYNITIQNKILEIFNNIFIYDYSKRLTINEYLEKYFIIE
jgi:serine/threonine protein kinase